MSDLSGKIVLVTGASRGIGYQAALEAARRGAHVVAVARTVGGLEELDDEIKAAGGQTTLVPLDVTDYDALDRLGAAIFERWKKLVPDMSRFLPDMVKKEVDPAAVTASQVELLVQETCVAEVVHTASILLGLGALWLWPGWGGCRPSSRFWSATSPPWIFASPTA